LNGDSIAALGAWTHSTVGKASIYSTSHIGNVKPTHTADFYDTALTEITCWNMADGHPNDATAKGKFTGLFNWCKMTIGATLSTAWDGDSDNSELRGDAALLMLGLSVGGMALPRFYSFQYYDAWAYTNTEMTSFRGGSDHGTKN